MGYFPFFIGCLRQPYDSCVLLCSEYLHLVVPVCAYTHCLGGQPYPLALCRFMQLLHKTCAQVCFGRPCNPFRSLCCNLLHSTVPAFLAA